MSQVKLWNLSNKNVWKRSKWCISPLMSLALMSFAICMFSAVALADVPALPGVKLADISDRVLTCRFRGEHIAAKGGAGVGCNARPAPDGKGLRVEFQIHDGNFIKCLLADLTDGEGGVYARTVGTGYRSDSKGDNVGFCFGDVSGDMKYEIYDLSTEVVELLPVIPQPMEWKPAAGECDLVNAKVNAKIDAGAGLGEEGYTMKIAPGAITVVAGGNTGAVWARQTLAQLKASGAKAKCGTIRDIPKYRVRAFMMDVGRMYHSMDFLYDLAKTMSYYKMNVLHIHLNDNAGGKDPNKYAAFRLESETYPELTAKDGHYTKKEFREFMLYCKSIGVTVIPEIDVPAHSLAFTRVRPDFASKKYGADHLDLDKSDEILAWLKPLFAEYMTGKEPTFAGPYVHVGTDEYNKKEAEKFRAFTDAMLKMVIGFGYKPCAWGALSHASGKTPVIASRDITMDIWNNRYYHPEAALKDGYTVVTIPDKIVYLVPFGGYYNDYFNCKKIYETWDPTVQWRYKIPQKYFPQLAGGKFALWNDLCGKKKDGTPYTEADNWDRIHPAIQTFAQKMWCGARADQPWKHFASLADSLSEPEGVKSAHKARLMHLFEISYEKDAFLLDGKSIQIRCGEMHFARVPRAYWRHRIKMCKAMGLNAICAYMFWNYHEMERGKYDFSGEKDIAEFCRIAQEEGMWVLLRPGPYTCAEWEFGGLPWWLLENGADKVKVRTRDIAYLKPSIDYMRRVADELRELQVTRGGPILMCQVENEYGSFGNDAELIRAYYKTMREAGFDIPIFTCNGAPRLRDGDIPEVYKAVNFGSRPHRRFADLRKVQPKGPLMCGEYYPAWFDSWGARHHTKPMKALLSDVGYMLSAGASFSIYMAHGGTTFGWWAGCNTPFHPQTSSYDYDAPISEQGRTTPKFFALRDLMKKHMAPDEAAMLPAPPAPIPLQAFKSDAAAELVAPATEKRLGGEMANPLAMEMLGQGYGAIVYTAKLGGKGGYLRVPNLRDQAAVFADGEFCGFLDRRYANRGVEIPEGRKTLRIVVTHMSRYNFGKAMGNTAKGLLAPVMLGRKEITGWTASAITPDCIASMKPSSGKNGPCTFKCFKVSCNSTADTFLLVRGWKKGHVWVNGRPLGRFWGIGPTQTMYVPGCWLKKGVNEFLVWDFGGNVPMKGLEFVNKPVLDELHPESDFIGAFKRESAPYAPPENPTMRGEFPNTSGLQTVKLPKTARGRRFAFVIDSAWVNQKDKKDMASIAEFDIIDAKGEVVPRGAWSFVSVSSEETAKEDGLAENAIDGQSVNYWHTRWSKDVPKSPHYLVIDMGAQVDVAGFRYLPRQDMTNGRVRAWRFNVE